LSGEASPASIYDALGLIVIRIDAELKVWYVNRFGLRLLGYSRLGQVFRRPLRELLGADSLHPPEFLAELRDIGGRGGVRQVETPLTTSDGRQLWISWSIEERVGADTVLAPIFLIGSDVTRVHQSLESALLFRDIAQNTPLSVIITDAERSILFANAAVLAVTGYAAEDVIGRKPQMFSSGLTPASTYRDMWAALGSGTSWSGELINQRKDGSVFTERLTISPITDQEGQISFFFAIGEDSTRQRELETQLEAFTTTDALTGLRNRIGFLAELTRLLKHVADANTGIAVVHIDIDDFDGVNRSLGHEQGDRLLVDIGKRLADAVRESDVVARLGSDEFGLLLIVPDLARRGTTTRRSRGGCGRHCGRPSALASVASRSLRRSASPVFRSTATSRANLLARASSATQIAKRDGGDGVARFDRAAEHADDLQRRELLGELRQVVENRQLLLHYQPQLSLHTGALIGRRGAPALAASGEGNDPAGPASFPGRKRAA
jgi:diguanylate cyclase (GGDEF)-like protein/PAS domain S-box-containing protein